MLERGVFMPKIKTHRGAAKRFSITATGKIKRKKAFKNHILNKKSSKRIRSLRKAGFISDGDYAAVKKLIPYK